MKWIGQHIWDLVARFRNNVYFEDSITLSTGKSITMDEYTSGTISITKIQDSGTTFNDNDTSLMTAAAIADKIEAYGYSTASGDITGVVLTADDSNTVSDTGGSADFTITGANGVTTSVDGTDFVIGGSNASTSAKGVVELATTAEVGTGTDTARAVTPDALADGYVGTANITTLGTISTGVWNGTAITKTYLNADQRNITQVGTLTSLTVDDIAIDTKTITITGDTDDTCTITTGAAGATTITTTDTAGAAGHFEIAADGDITLDAAGTIKLEGPVRSSGQLQFTYHNFTDDIDTTKVYLSLADADTEAASPTTGIKLPFTAPLAGKLMRIYLKANKNLTAHTLTWRLETQAAGVTFGTGPSVVGTQSGAGCNTTTMTTYDFTSSLDSGDNVIDAGDSVYLSIQDDTATANTKWYVTCLWEWDMSSIG